MCRWLVGPQQNKRPPVILTCSGCCSWPPAQLGSIILGGWPSWGAPAPQTPRTWRLRRQQGRGGLRPPRPKWGGRRPSAAAPPFWGPLLAPEAPGPGGLGGGSPPGRPAPQKFVTNLCWCLGVIGAASDGPITMELDETKWDRIPPSGALLAPAGLDSCNPEPCGGRHGRAGCGQPAGRRVVGRAGAPAVAVLPV